MIKFSKPESTAALLSHLFTSLFHPSSAPPIPDYSESDSIVANLRKLTNSPTAWRDELTFLSEQGYIPEIVFIDAGHDDAQCDEPKEFLGSVQGGG